MKPFACMNSTGTLNSPYMVSSNVWHTEVLLCSTLVCCVEGVSLMWACILTLKADSHIACRAHAVTLPCPAAKGLECVFPIWFTRCGRVCFTLAMPCPCCAHVMLWPCRSSQGHGAAWLSRDGLWATCPCSASSGYHAEFRKDCYQKHTNPPHNDPYLRL